MVLLTITTMREPATDLGYLLHKNPARARTFATRVGTARVFPSVADAQRRAAALELEVDSIALVRGRPGTRGRGPREAFSLGALRQRPSERGVERGH